MKSIILLVFLVLIAGCSEPISTQNGRVIYDGNGLRIKRYLIDGHVYLYTCGGYDGGITHDMRCPCFDKKILEKEEVSCSHKKLVLSTDTSSKKYYCEACGKEIQ